MHPELLLKLERLRSSWNRVILITSGYRCPAHNAEVGGAINSWHKRGLACDVAVRAGEQEYFRSLALSEGFTKVICYPERNFVHIELGEDL